MRPSRFASRRVNAVRNPITVKTNASFDRSLTTTGNLIPTVGVDLDRQGNMMLAWLEADGRTGDEIWTLHAARVAPGPEHALLFAGRVRSPGHGVWSGAYEFLQVQSTPSDGTLIAYPWDVSGCEESQPESAELGRNEQCVELIHMRAPS